MYPKTPTHTRSRFILTLMVISILLLSCLSASAREPEHSMLVSSVSFSSDCRMLAAGFTEGTVRVWEVPSGRLIRELNRPEVPVSAVQFSPDGRYLAVGSENSKVVVWSVRDWTPNHLLDHRGAVHSIAFSPDGKTLACSSTVASQAHVQSGEVRLWDLPSGKLRMALGTPDWTRHLVFSPDGRYLAADSGGRLLLWGLPDGKSLRDIVKEQGLGGVPAFSPDGGMFACAVRGSILVYNISDWSLVHKIGLPKEYEGVLQGGDLAFSADGKSLIGSANGIAVFDLNTGKMTKTLATTLTPVVSMAVSQNGKYVAAGSGPLGDTGRYQDFIAGAVDLYDASTGKLIRTMTAHTSEVLSLAYSPDGQSLVSGSRDGTAKVWDGVSGDLKKTLPHGGSVWGVAFSLDGKSIVTGAVIGDKPQAFRWNTRNGELLHQVPMSVTKAETGVDSVCLSGNGRMMAGRAFSGLNVWDVITGNRTVVLHNEVNTRRPVLSADGRFVAGLGNGEKLSVWDVTTGTTKYTMDHPGEVSTISFSPDGRFLAASGSFRIKKYESEAWLGLWDMQTGKLIKLIKSNESDDFRGTSSLAFSPDSRMLVTADEAVCFRDLTNLRSTPCIYTADLGVTAVAFSPDGKRLAVGSVDGRVQQYDLGKESAHSIKELEKLFNNPEMWGRENKLRPTLDALTSEERNEIALIAAKHLSSGKLWKGSPYDRWDPELLDRPENAGLKAQWITNIHAGQLLEYATSRGFVTDSRVIPYLIGALDHPDRTFVGRDAYLLLSSLTQHRTGDLYWNRWPDPEHLSRSAFGKPAQPGAKPRSWAQDQDDEYLHGKITAWWREWWEDNKGKHPIFDRKLNELSQAEFLRVAKVIKDSLSDDFPALKAYRERPYMKMRFGGTDQLYTYSYQPEGKWWGDGPNPDYSLWLNISLGLLTPDPPELRYRSNQLPEKPRHIKPEVITVYEKVLSGTDVVLQVRVATNDKSLIDALRRVLSGAD